MTSPPTAWEIDAFPLHPAESAAPPVSEPVKATDPAPPEYSEGLSLRTYLEECEKTVLRSLRERGYAPKQIAAILKLDVSNVYRRMQKYGME